MQNPNYKKTAKDETPGILTKYESLIRLKNLQLEGLKTIAVALAETEDEASFILTVLPIIKTVMSIDGSVTLFTKINNETINISDFSDTAVQKIWGCLITDHGFTEEPIFVDHEALRKTLSRASIPNGFKHNTFSPIFHADTNLGFFSFQQKHPAHYTEDNTIFLKYLGEAMGVFFNTSKLRNELSHAKQRLEQNFNELFAVYSVSKVISSYLDTQSILENTLHTIFSQEILNLDPQGCVFLLNEMTGRLEMAHHIGLPQILTEAETSIPLGHCLCGHAAQSGEIITSRDCLADARHHTRYKDMSQHGHIVVPLKNHGKVIGVLCLYIQAGETPTINQINMLSTIANHLGVALENAQLYEEIKHLSLHDSLTGLANRNLLQARLEEEISRAMRYSEPLAVAMVDIDHFKDFNDAYGHVAGDKILKDLSTIFREVLRKCDLVARFGGEEFTILLPHTDIYQALIPLERIRNMIENYQFTVPGTSQPVQITISIGVCANSSDIAKTGNVLLETADKALYRAKEDGRNKTVSCDEILE